MSDPPVPGIEDVLRRYFVGKDTITAGRLQIICLEPLKDKFGERWPQVADRIVATAQGIIAEHLAASDLLLPCRDLAFLVLFGELSTKEAEIKAAMLATAITHRVLGEDGASIPTLVRTVVAALDGRLVLAESCLADTLDRLLADKTADASAPVDAPAPTSDADLWRPVGTSAFDSKVDTVYRPVWDVRRRVLSAYLCSVPDTERWRRADAHDLAILERAIGDLHCLYARGERVFVIVPIHAATLGHRRSRQIWLERLGTIPRPLREGIVLNVRGLSPEMPQSRIVDLVSHLRAVDHALIATLPLTPRLVPLLTATGIGTIGAEIGRANDEAAIMEAMGRFAEATLGSRTVLFAQGLSSSSLAVAALGAGFVYLEGAAIHPPVPAPANVARFGVEKAFLG